MNLSGGLTKEPHSQFFLLYTLILPYLNLFYAPLGKFKCSFFNVYKNRIYVMRSIFGVRRVRAAFNSQIKG